MLLLTLSDISDFLDKINKHYEFTVNFKSNQNKTFPTPGKFKFQKQFDRYNFRI